MSTLMPAPRHSGLKIGHWVNPRDAQPRPAPPRRLLTTACGRGKKDGLSWKYEIRTERDGFNDIVASANTAVDQELNAIADRRSDCRQYFDGCRCRIQLPAVMIGDSDAIDAKIGNSHGVVGIQDAFHDECAGPIFANAREDAPVEQSGRKRSCRCRSVRHRPGLIGKKIAGEHFERGAPWRRLRNSQRGWRARSTSVPIVGRIGRLKPLTRSRTRFEAVGTSTVTSSTLTSAARARSMLSSVTRSALVTLS